MTSRIPGARTVVVHLTVLAAGAGLVVGGLTAASAGAADTSAGTTPAGAPASSGATTGASTGASTGAATGTGPAGTRAAAARRLGAPDFLDPAELPQDPQNPWQAGEVAQGLPEFGLFCLDGSLPSTGALHRQYGTDLDANATQVIVSAPDEADARSIARKVARSVERCAARYERENPDGTASWRYYGTLDIEDGVRVYGVQTSHPDGEPGISLFAVGRDGDTVTAVRWAQIGGYQDAPVRAFKRTARTAVDKMLG
jgi:hypothetical protein